MLNILALLQCLAPVLPPTTLRQFSRIILALLAMPGRVTMRGISRWTEPGGSYRSVQRFFNTAVDWSQVHWLLIKTHLPQPQATYLLVGDEVVVTKAGHETHGLDRFFSSLFGKLVPGLAFFAFALMNVQQRTAYPLRMGQVLRPEPVATPVAAASTAPVAKQGRGRPKGSKNRHKAAVALSPSLSFILTLRQAVKQVLGTTHECTGEGIDEAILFVGEAYMADNIPTLEKADLLKPVQNLLKSDTVDVVKWELRPLTGNWGNESSVGIFKVSGQASDNNILIDWVMVLKIVQSPANKGMPWEGDDPNSLVYWRREACLFETDFLASVPQIFVVPACYGVVEHPGKIVWLWFEFIDNSCGNDWSLERYATVARQLGRFNGAYLAGRSLPNNAWLSRNFLRQWADVNYTKIFMPYWANADQQMLFWEHPVIQKAMGAPGANVLCRLIHEHIRFIDILDGLPQTLCHRDCWVTNLMCSADSEQFTLIDWQLVGIGPAGEDLIQLIWGMLEVQSALPVEGVERQLFAQYLQGLRDSGWQGVENQVRFAYAASFVLRVGYLVIWLLNNVFPLRIDAPTEPNYYLETLNDELVARHTPLIDMVLKRAKEAWDLLEQLEAQ